MITERPVAPPRPVVLAAWQWTALGALVVVRALSTLVSPDPVLDYGLAAALVAAGLDVTIAVLGQAPLRGTDKPARARDPRRAVAPGRLAGPAGDPGDRGAVPACGERLVRRRPR